MSDKLISANALMEYAQNQILRSIDCNDIARFPAVDAVAVVRCGECFYHKDSCFAGEGNIYCDVHMKYFPKDGFCSSGERREDNAVD